MGHRSGGASQNVGNMALEVRRGLKAGNTDLKVVFAEVLVKAIERMTFSRHSKKRRLMMELREKHGSRSDKGRGGLSEENRGDIKS